MTIETWLPRCGPWLLLLLAGAGCANAGMLRAARAGDRASLARALAAANARGALSLGEAADVGHAVLEHELRTAAPPEAALRIDEVRGCAEDVDDALRERMKGNDAAAGIAAMQRAETGALDGSAARAYVTSADDHFRAASMSAMTRDRDRDARLGGLVDGSVLVRSLALRAVIRHDDPADFEAVLEVARKDPAPLLRSTAVRALARMAGAPPDLADRLRDLWTSGDDALREDVAAVLASRAVYANGGHDALAHLLTVSRGNEAVGVAGAVLGSDVPDPALRAAASGVLAQALADGGTRTRIHAIAVMPVGNGGPEEQALKDALTVATHAEDVDVRLAALGRLATAPGTPAVGRSAAVSSLEELAAPDGASPERVARARFLLATAGDLRIQAWLESDLGSREASVRLRAVEALSTLGRASRAAPLMADDDAEVRSRAACTIVAAARMGRPSTGRRM